MEILTELQRQMGSVGDLRETNRTSPLANHLSTVSEGITALGWITIEPDPAEFIADIFGSAQFFGNRVLKEYKERYIDPTWHFLHEEILMRCRDRAHVDWVQSFYQIFKSLAAYVKQHHPGGLYWNKDGLDAREVMQQVQQGSPNSETAAPTSNGAPPPPPPPLPTFDNPASQPTKGRESSDMDAVFAQLNQGEGVTSGLRKVDKSEMTHKNPALRAGATVPNRTGSQTSLSSTTRGKSPVPPGKKPKPESMRTKKPPRKELDGNKWVIVSI